MKNALKVKFDERMMKIEDERAYKFFLIAFPIISILFLNSIFTFIIGEVSNFSKFTTAILYFISFLLYGVLISTYLFKRISASKIITTVVRTIVYSFIFFLAVNVIYLMTAQIDYQDLSVYGSSQTISTLEFVFQSLIPVFAFVGLIAGFIFGVYLLGIKWGNSLKKFVKQMSIYKNFEKYFKEKIEDEREVSLDHAKAYKFFVMFGQMGIIFCIIYFVSWIVQMAFYFQLSDESIEIGNLVSTAGIMMVIFSIGYALTGSVFVRVNLFKFFLGGIVFSILALPICIILNSINYSLQNSMDTLSIIVSVIIFTLPAVLGLLAGTFFNKILLGFPLSGRRKVL